MPGRLCSLQLLLLAIYAFLATSAMRVFFHPPHTLSSSESSSLVDADHELSAPEFRAFTQHHLAMPVVHRPDLLLRIQGTSSSSAGEVGAAFVEQRYRVLIRVQAPFDDDDLTDAARRGWFTVVDDDDRAHTAWLEKDFPEGVRVDAAAADLLVTELLARVGGDAVESARVLVFDVDAPSSSSTFHQWFQQLSDRMAVEDALRDLPYEVVVTYPTLQKRNLAAPSVAAQQQQQPLNLAASSAPTFEGYTKNITTHCYKTESQCTTFTKSCSSSQNGTASTLAQRGVCERLNLADGEVCWRCGCQPSFTGYACQYTNYVESVQIVFWTVLITGVSMLGGIGVLYSLG